MASNKGLTKREAQVMDFIRSFSLEYGCGPSIREIAKQLGNNSPNGPLQLVNNLAKKGFIVRHPKISRGIKINDLWSNLLRKIATLPVEDLKRIVKENGL